MLSPHDGEHGNLSRAFWSCARAHEKSGSRGKRESPNHHRVQNPFPVPTAYGCCYRSPPWWLMVTYLLNPTVIEVTNLKGVSVGYNQGVGRAAFCWESLRQDPFPCLFQILEAVHVPWIMAPSAIFRAESIRPSATQADTSHLQSCCLPLP